MKLTSYKDINEILILLKKDLLGILGENLLGLYLIGSLTYGDFDKGSSDIDLFVVTHRPLSKNKLSEIIKMHNHIGKLHPEWHKRIEVSYITQKMLLDKKPPKKVRPYFNAGKMWHFPFGYEWILNLYQLYKYGVTIYGPGPKNYVKRVNTNDVIKASRANLLNEWQPKLKESTPFKNADYDRSHLQAYAILTMCRILYVSKNKKFSTKKEASLWAKNIYNNLWSVLIDKAEKWKHGDEMNAEQETLSFIKFTIDETGV